MTTWLSLRPQFHAALCDAFDFPALRSLLLSLERSRRIDHIIIPAEVGLDTVVDRVIERAVQESWLEYLAQAAQTERSHNQVLVELTQLILAGVTQHGAAFYRGYLADPVALARQQQRRDFIARVSVLMFPTFWEVRDRRDLLQSLYYPGHTALLHKIRLEGAFEVFAPHCLNTLLDWHGPLVNPLLDLLNRLHGVDKQAAIAALAGELAALCAADAPSTALRVAAPPLPTGLAQTGFRPTLFLVHSDDDVALVNRLRADLARHGYACSLPRPHGENEETWLAATLADLGDSYAALLVAGARTENDTWAQVELLAALDLSKPLFVVRAAAAALPDWVPTGSPAVECGGLVYADGLAALVERLPAPPLPAAARPVAGEPAPRAAELLAMHRLRLAELRHVARYTRLSGRSQLRRAPDNRLSLEPVVARPEFVHTPWRQAGGLEAPPVETRRFEDAVTELLSIRRAVLLGEPGSGKTTTLFKLAAERIAAARRDSAAPVPLMLRLGEWTDAGESFDAFLARRAGPLTAHLGSLLRAGRAALLLDGLNELPADQQAAKYRQVDAFLARHPGLPAIVACREQDYPPERALALDRVTVEPLDPARIHAFIHAYLDPQADPDVGEDLFWQLAGEAVRRTYAGFMASVGSRLENPLAAFWLADQLPAGAHWGWGIPGYEDREWESWLHARALPASLLRLAANPYLLTMLLDVYQAYGQALPANRGQLFDQFVTVLLQRERLATPDLHSGVIQPTPAGAALLAGLTELAFAMQTQRPAGAEGGALTVLPLAATASYLDAVQRYQAASANLLTVGDGARFAHQLLQEYFAARAMRERIFNVPPGAAALQAAEIWPADRWWQPTNWEEAAILLAGLYSDDCTPVLEWLADASPELAARCITESGAHTPEATKLHLRARWLPRLTDTRRDPTAHARAAVGRALGRVRLADGAPLDNRPGVGWVLQRGVKIPDIAWGAAVPAGRYPVGRDASARYSFKKHTIPIAEAYQLARYPVTYVQFQCFVEAADGADERWWAGMPERVKDWNDKVYSVREWGEQAFKFDNHPRENVSWYQAIAFCRWLSDKLGYEVTLPTEYEWEVAARYPDGRVYPWGDEFDAAKANTNESGIGQTTAVGLFPDGTNPALGLYDLSGNVWEWCRNRYDNPTDDKMDDSGADRALRGGSWLSTLDRARAAYRNWYGPNYRDTFYGFRVARRPPSHPL